MKAYWYNGGLHIKPETDQESAALHVLFDSIEKSDLFAVSPSVRGTFEGINDQMRPLVTAGDVKNNKANPI